MRDVQLVVQDDHTRDRESRLLLEDTGPRCIKVLCALNRFGCGKFATTGTKELLLLLKSGWDDGIEN